MTGCLFEGCGVGLGVAEESIVHAYCCQFQTNLVAGGQVIGSGSQTPDTFLKLFHCTSDGDRLGFVAELSGAEISATSTQVTSASEEWEGAFKAFAGGELFLDECSAWDCMGVQVLDTSGEL